MASKRRSGKKRYKKQADVSDLTGSHYRPEFRRARKRHSRARSRLVPEVLIECADCGGIMRRGYHRRKWMYSCSRCNGKLTCHPNGELAATPARREVRTDRHNLHHLFDMLWRGKTKVMSRPRAYEWLAHTVGDRDAHIGTFDLGMCEAVAIKLLTLWDGVFRKIHEEIAETGQSVRDYARHYVSRTFSERMDECKNHLERQDKERAARKSC